MDVADAERRVLELVAARWAILSMLGRVTHRCWSSGGKDSLCLPLGSWHTSARPFP